MFFVLGLAFVLCHFGDIVDNQFDHLNTVIIQTHWYNYPLYIQKHLLIIQPMAQQSTCVRGYPNLDFDHIFFQKVIFPSFYQSSIDV